MPVSQRYAGIPGIERRWNYACEVTHHRRLFDLPAKRQMIEAAERYNHTVVFPLHDVEGEPDFPPIAAAIIADSIDGFATKANDTLPVITAPAVDPTALSHRKRAEQRKQAWGATYAESHLPLRTGRAYRQLFGYGTFCMFAEPMHYDQYGRPLKRVRINTRDPLLTYPEPLGNDEIRAPSDIAFVYGRSPQQLISMYPEAETLIRDHTGTDDDLWDVLEWMDKDWCFIGILGKRANQSWWRRYDAQGNYSVRSDAPIDQSFLVEAYPNRAGMVTAVCPEAVTLDRLVSAITRIIPITDLMNKLAAINFIAAEKSTFPTIAVIGDQGTTPSLVDGVFHDGREGKANLIEGARGITSLNLQPGAASQILLSDMERSARLSSGNPAVFQGEGSGSIRSGQTVSQLAGYSVDPRVSEAHKLMGYTLEVMNECIAAIEQGYWPQREYTVFSGWQGVEKHVKYTPNKIWPESDKSVVTYPMPGMDATNATIAIGQLNQARMMSRRTGMKKHPLVDDPDGEETRLMEESLDDAIVMSALELVRSGQLAWTDLGVIRAKVREGKVIEQAIAEAQEEAQARQAEQAPPPEAGQIMPPEAMPGLNAPGAGGEMAPPPEPQGAPPGQAAQFEQIAQALMSGAPAGGPAGGVPAEV